MKCYTNCHKVIEMCDSIISQIEEKRSQFYEEHINYLMTKKFFPIKTREQAEKHAEKQRRKTLDYINYDEYNDYQYIRVKRLHNKCINLTKININIVILENDDLIDLGFECD